MTAITTNIERPGAGFPADPAELASIAFLARYSGRTLDAYRHDLRNLFQWAADHDLAVFEATRAHLELYRTSMEARGLAASTIDRRLSTACGYYRFAHIDGRERGHRVLRIVGKGNKPALIPAITQGSCSTTAPLG